MSKFEKAEKLSLQQHIDHFLDSDAPSVTATKFLIAILAIGGVMVTGALIPGIISLANSKKYKKHKYSSKQLHRAVHVLKHRKLIEIIEENDGKTKVKLSNKGESRIKELCFQNLRIKKPKKWDGKWRALIFDIPTYPKAYNRAREALRLKVKQLGFVQLQKSVWVCPYECEDEILFLSEIYNVEKFIEIFTIERLLHESELKRKFKLA